MNAENIAAPRVVVKDLNFFYGKYRALKDINLEIADKKVTAFIGPSGCGKSTLLRTFNRMYQLYPQQTATGAIMLDGDNILDKGQDLNKLRAKVGMVFQKPTPFPMSIYDNIAFGVKLYQSLSKNEMDERVEWALKKAALWTKSKINSSKAVWGYPAVSNSVCASPALSPSSRKSCCSMSRLRAGSDFNRAYRKTDR